MEYKKPGILSLLSQIEESQSLILALERKMNEAKQGQERKIREMYGSNNQAMRLTEEMNRSDANSEGNWTNLSETFER